MRIKHDIYVYKYKKMFDYLNVLVLGHLYLAMLEQTNMELGSGYLHSRHFDILIDPYRFCFVINTRFSSGQSVCPCLKRLMEAHASSAGPPPRGLLTGLDQQQLDRSLTVVVVVAASQPPQG